MVDLLGHTMTSVVINPFFRLGIRPVAAHPVPRDRNLRSACQRMTQTHPSIPPEPGAPTAWPTLVIIDHLQRAQRHVELMPVHQSHTTPGC